MKRRGYIELPASVKEKKYKGHKPHRFKIKQTLGINGN
jgi:hypothetical protein